MIFGEELLLRIWSKEEPEPMTFAEALKKTYESEGRLGCGPTAIPGDAIIWDPLTGWRWLKSGQIVTMLTPSLLFSPWTVGEV
jgi:hypothetical protein